MGAHGVLLVTLFDRTTVLGYNIATAKYGGVPVSPV